MKELNLNKTVAELVGMYPELKDVMASIGFKEITNPAALNLMGKVMTIPKGCQVKGFDLNDVIKKLNEAGFACVYDKEPKKASKQYNNEESSVDDSTPEGREKLLEGMIKRLNDGEALESVRKDFVKHFEHVSVKEITGVEQRLINEGMPVEEVQQLCDIHSALFHGKTEQEVMQEEEGERLDIAHPVSQLKLENRVIEKKIEDTLQQVNNNDAKGVLASLTELKKIKPHYAKKEELLMPLLKRYGYPGPGTVMWGVDDEIKEELSRLVRTINEPKYFETEKDNINGVLNRMKEMIYKEESILFPLCLENFTQEDWYHVYEDLDAMGPSLARQRFIWEEAENYLNNEEAEHQNDGLIHLATGVFTSAQLMAMLDSLPMDMTFIDETDHVLFFKDKMHIFPRPKSCIGKLVYDCHPDRVKPMVEAMIQDFKDKQRDHVDIWMKNIRVRYMAVYADEKYIGTLELVEDFSEAFEHQKKDA